MAEAAGAQASNQIPDRVIMYASYFNYNPKDRAQMLKYTPDLAKVQGLESK